MQSLKKVILWSRSPGEKRWNDELGVNSEKYSKNPR